MTNDPADASVWPDVHVAGWAPTKRKLAPVPADAGQAARRAVPGSAELDVHRSVLVGAGARDRADALARDVGRGVAGRLSSELIVERSNGDSRRIALVPARCVADVYADLQAALRALDVECAISPIPQEVADTTPLPEDRRPAEYEPAAVRRWFTAATATAGVFDEWRAHFFGRNGIQVWWGALDVTLLLFSGKHVAPPADRGYLMKYDLDAELMNVGLYCGDEHSAPTFYGYIFPQPPGAENLPMAPAGASWSTALSEWVLPYDIVRAAADPSAMLRTFLDALYAQCVTAAGWDRAALSYVAPTRAQRRPSLGQ